MKALVHQRNGYELWCLDVCWAIVGKFAVRLEPLRCHGGEWPAGTRFWHLGGEHKSAGFCVVDFRGFEPLEYVGMVTTLEDGELACFRAGERPEGGYFAYSPSECGLIFSTRAVAGRVIEMTKAEFDLPPGGVAMMPNAGAQRRGRRARPLRSLLDLYTSQRAMIDRASRGKARRPAASAGETMHSGGTRHR